MSAPTTRTGDWIAPQTARSSRQNPLEEWREDGWSATTPPGDTVLHGVVHALAEATAVPAVALGARLLRTDALVATDLGRPGGYWNAATMLRPLGPQEWAAVLDRLEAFVADAGAEPRRFDLWSPFPTPDLRVRGWDLSGHVPLMWRPAGPGPRVARRGLRVEVVHDGAGLRTWARTAVEAFPLEGNPATITAALLDQPGVRLFLASRDGRPVGISSTVVTHGLNVVTLVAVRAEARGQGIGAAVTQAATCVRADLPAALLASDDGRPVYERLGYLPLVRWPMWVRHVSAAR